MSAPTFSGPDFDKLPRGEWVIFGSLPAETTSANFGEWLHTVGFDITPDRVLVQSYGRRCSAIVSFPHSEFAVLVNWVINKQPFIGGFQAVAQPYAKAHRAKVIVPA